jgi:hypothetical protein
MRFRIHTQTSHTWYGPSGRVIGPSQQSLANNTYNTHGRHSSIPPVVFEPTIPKSQRPKTYALNCTATGIAWLISQADIICNMALPTSQRTRSMIIRKNVQSVLLREITGIFCENDVKHQNTVREKMLQHVLCIISSGLWNINGSCFWGS